MLESMPTRVFVVVAMDIVLLNAPSIGNLPTRDPPQVLLQSRWSLILLKLVWWCSRMKTAMSGRIQQCLMLEPQHIFVAMVLSGTMWTISENLVSLWSSWLSPSAIGNSTSEEMLSLGADGLVTCPSSWTESMAPFSATWSLETPLCWWDGLSSKPWSWRWISEGKLWSMVPLLGNQLFVDFMENIYFLSLRASALSYFEKAPAFSMSSLLMKIPRMLAWT